MTHQPDSVRRSSARSSRFALRAISALGLIGAATFSPACHEPLDTTRQAGPKGTLGDDIYGVLCDRLGASSLTEDITGESYHGICHFDPKGNYRDEVAAKYLPPAKSAKSKEIRRLGVAKMEKLAARRGDVVRALNASFPDVDIDNVASSKEGDTIGLHDALMELAQALTPLYEGSPFGEEDEPLMPASTRSLGRLFGAMEDSQPARDALSRMWGRKGYRPLGAALGAIRSALAYPNLRALTKSSVALLGPNGVASPELQQVLTVTRRELETSVPVVAPLPTLFVDPTTAQPNRPRTNSEALAQALMRGPDNGDPSLSATSDEAPRYLTLRDRRGFVFPAGAASGPIPGPFVDQNGDGFADVDLAGRFVDASGSALPLDPPFWVPGLSVGPVDPYGRPEGLPYTYLDTSRTVARSLGWNLLPLVDATQYGTPGDPNAYASEHESLMYALAGAYTLYGPREEAVYDYAAGQILPAGSTCDGCVPYTRFRAEDSPIPSLVHAMGQVLADADSDALLLGTMDLFENHEAAVARLVGASLRLREIAKEHDALAAQGQEPKAELAYEVPIWDEVAAIVERIVQKPKLTEKLLAALADERMVTSYGGSQHMGETLAKFMKYRDELVYNPFDINGPASNLTVGNGSTADPKTPVSRTPPLAGGTNRSCFQRSIQTIHDASGVTACNKDGAVANVDLGWISVSYPLFGSYDQCELFQFDDLAVFYLHSILPPAHPKRSVLVINDSTLQGIMDIGASIGLDPDDLFQQSSGITGLTLTPDPPALNRLVFFGADSDTWSMPDRDNINAGGTTDTFVSSLIEPVPSTVCPKVNGVNKCSNRDDSLRLYDGTTSNGGTAKKGIFLWERFGFYDYLRPMVEAFSNGSCNDDASACDLSDTSGELAFVELINVLHRNWPGKEHGAECDKTGTPETNPKYCSEAGVNSYEPILVDSFESDLIPALHEFAIAASQLSQITVARGPKAGEVWSGAKVMETMTKVLFDSQYAKSVGMVDRKGNAATAWTSGKPQAQLTVYTLFADALHAIDKRWDDACVGAADVAACQADVAQRKGQWKQARSQLVDQFLAVEGTGSAAHFKNRGLVRTGLSVLRTLREQLNANCPDREYGGACTWARTDMAKKVEEVLSGPLFASLMDLQEALRADEPSRRQLETFLSYMLGACAAPSPPPFCPANLAGAEDPLSATMASMVDILQLLSNDDNLAPIFNSVANAANPESDQRPGMADTTIKVLTALTDDRYDRYHVLDHILPAIVTPMDGGGSPSPIEIIFDTLADVHRIDASSNEPLTPDDYATILRSVREFLSSETRGMEQFYSIVQNRPRE
jgi:hypothetical protein